MNPQNNAPLENYLSQGTVELRNFINNKYISGNKLELDRVTRYFLFWNFYEGNHYKDFNDSMLSFNYVKAFIDKVNIFLLGESCFSFKVNSYYNDVIEEELERSVEKLMLYTWRKNRYHVLMHEVLQMGSICGDAWVGLGWDADEKVTKMTLFDSRQCFPTFKDGDITKLESFTTRVPLETNDKGYVLHVTEYTKTQINSWKQKNSAEIVGDKDKFNLTTSEHQLDTIPVVHFKNRPNSSSYYGKSDANDILKINKIYNEMHQEVKSIIDYYATPTTIVTGANIKNLKRGLGNVWSGLPPEANVYNLGLDVDLSATTAFLDKLKLAMHEISDVPENVLGKTQAISGTSAAALKLTYQPLVQQADMKSLTYGEGVIAINSLILKFIGVYNKNNKIYKEIPRDFLEEYYVEPIWSYGFPTDRMQLLQEAQYELQMKVASKREIMNKLGKNNVVDLAEEIRRELIEEAEIQKEISEITGQQEPKVEPIIEEDPIEEVE